MEQQRAQSIPIPRGKNEVSKSETWNIPTLPSLLLETPKHWNGFALLGCSLCSDKKDLEKDGATSGLAAGILPLLWTPGQGWRSDGSFPQCPQCSQCPVRHQP